MQRIYLDYAASAPLAVEAQTIIQEFAQNPSLGNPSSLHAEGRTAQALLDKAHTTVAAVFGVHPTEVIFTSGATEANVMAIKGVLQAWRKSNPNKVPHVIYSALEHASWRSVALSEGVDITVIPVSQEGVVTVGSVSQAIKDTTVLVGCTYVSNEIGTIQPIAEIGKAVEAWRQDHKSKWPIFHVDAVQAFPYLNTHIGHTHADAMTFSGHKYGAFGGIGALILKKHVPFESIIKGGGQEWGYRAGTENVLGAQTLAAAMEWADSNREDLTQHVSSLQKELEQTLARELPQLKILGQNVARSPHITYLWLPNVLDESVVHRLDLAGVAVSSGSACSSGAMLPSSTLLALGFTETEAFGGLRISYGRGTTEVEINSFIVSLKKIVQES